MEINANIGGPTAQLVGQARDDFRMTSGKVVAFTWVLGEVE
jgi:hypothetical protein